MSKQTQIWKLKKELTELYYSISRENQESCGLALLDYIQGNDFEPSIKRMKEITTELRSLGEHVPFSLFEDDKWFNLIGVVVSTGRRIKLNDTPMTHDQACTFKNKHTPHKHLMLILEEVKQEPKS